MSKKELDSTKAKKGFMLLALKMELGRVLPASELAGISRSTHYKWMKEDEVYKNQVLNIKEDSLDFAEGKLMEVMKKGSTKAIIFYLRTQGKSRGYGNLNSPNIQAPQPSIADRLNSKYTFEQMEEMLKEVREKKRFNNENFGTS